MDTTSAKTTPGLPRGALAAAAVSGCAYALGALVPQVDGPGVETAGAGTIRSFLVAHDTGLRVLASGGVAAMVLVLVFSTALARLIRAQRPGSQLADLVVAGGIVVAVWHWIVVAATASTLVQSLDGFPLARVDDSTLRDWYALTNFAHLFGDLGMVGMAAVMGATSIAIVRTGLLRRWIGWLGVVCAAGGLVGTLGITSAWTPLADVWFLGIFGWFAWSLVVGMACALRLRRGSHAVPVPATTG